MAHKGWSLDRLRHRAKHEHVKHVQDHHGSSDITLHICTSLYHDNFEMFKHGLWSSWFTAPNGVLATPRFFRCWPVINSLIWSYSPRNVHGFCIFFHHPSSFTMVYQCLPWVMMVYHVIYPGWNRKSLFASKQPLPLPRICILLLGPKKKSCGQMWPPETGWNWIQRNESGTVVFINDIQDDTKYIKIRY